ncbi:hypothetical protein EV363DRAFT_1199503 [Boletus edulis]|nr:hypothetical protein EV363DRAFT_1199503 [Boletus edulis]
MPVYSRFQVVSRPSDPIPMRPRLYTTTSQDKITRSERCIPHHMRCSTSVVVPAYQESG